MTGSSTPTRPTEAPRDRPRRRRATLAVGVLLAGLALSGCDAPVPTITWYGNRTSTNVGPTVFCELTAEAAPDCRVTDGPKARLSLHPDDKVQVNIPAEVAEEPWVLVSSYVDDDTSVRSPVNTTKDTLSYVITPEPGKQLKQVDLQVLTIVVDENGQPAYAPIKVWVLEVDPVA